MRAYTLRLPNELMDRLRQLAIEERRTVRQILEDLIRKKLGVSEPKGPAIELQEAEEAAKILQKLDDREVLAGIKKNIRR